MSALTKNQLLAVITAANKPVAHEVANLGTLYFKKLTIAEQNELAKLNEAQDNITTSINMVGYSLCDENGKTLLNKSEFDELGKLSTEQLTAIVEVITDINGFNEKAGDIKKN